MSEMQGSSDRLLQPQALGGRLSLERDDAACGRNTLSI